MAILAICFALDAGRRGDRQTQTFTLPSLDMRIPGAGPGPAPLDGISALPPLERAEITFEANSHIDAYPNFFQTSDGPHALRLELVQPTRLQLILGDGVYLAIADNFPLRTWQRFQLTFVHGERIEVRLDDRLIFSSREPQLTNLELAFDNFVVGTGFIRQRDFVGEIRNFSVQATYFEAPAWWKRLLLATLTCLAVAALILLLLRSAEPSHPPVPAPLPALPGIGLAALGLMILFGAFGWFAYTHPLPMGKWNLLFFLAPLLLLPAHFGPRPVAERFWAETWLLAGLALVAAAFYGWSNWVLLPTSSRNLVYLLPAILAAIPLVSTRGGLIQSIWHATEAVAIGLIVTGALCPLPNWQVLAEVYAAHPSLTLGLLTLLFAGLHRICLAPPADRAAAPGAKVAALLPYALFAFLALRQDSLFTAGSEMHWEYYVGPVRTVREGGWLLWDTPSQYGFLNILLPALLPVASAWQAFYLFQAAILFACAVLLYRLARESMGGWRWVIAFLVAVLFFFADPSLIGPSPYPSSSGLRFLWVYVLLGQAAWILGDSVEALPRFVRQATWSWLAGVAWSAESALYSTAVFLAPVLLIAHHRWLHRARPGETFRLLTRPLLAGAGAVVILGLYYRLRLGHWPDLSMHALHATAYAGGFGEMALTWHGPLWLFGLILALSLAVIAQSPLTAPRTPALAVATVAAALWIVATYFVGRAVPQNVTALFPLLGLGLFLVHRYASYGTVDGGVAHLSRPALVCFLGVAVATCLAAVTVSHPPFPSVGFTGIDRRLRPADAELTALLERAALPAGAATVYYGHAASMPRLTGTVFAHTWLPNPLQLLEDPIAPERQEQIFSRYLARRRDDGYIIQARGQFEERFERWCTLLSSSHELVESFESEHYRILHYRPRRSG